MKEIKRKKEYRKKMETWERMSEEGRKEGKGEWKRNMKHVCLGGRGIRGENLKCFILIEKALTV